MEDLQIPNNKGEPMKLALIAIAYTVFLMFASFHIYASTQRDLMTMRQQSMMGGGTIKK
jgi:hypothetical protein